MVLKFSLSWPFMTGRTKAEASHTIVVVVSIARTRTVELESGMVIG